MHAPATGYVDDVSYVNLFHRHATPAWLHFVATALGHAAPDPAGVAWCELGCGPGFGTVLTAAANPRSRFTGIDFNAAHVQAAQSLAARTGTGNVRFVRQGLQDAADAPDEGARYDVISVVGVYAWVSPADRDAVRRFVARHLKPGGLLYLTYSCLPGMAWFTGMQSTLVALAREASGTSADRAVTALRQLRTLAEAAGSRVVEHPAQLAELARAAEGDARYLAHEFLSPHWTPLDPGAVMRSLASLDCHFIGSAEPAENIDEFVLAPALRAVLEALPAGAARESARALALRQSMRHDVYRRGAGALALDAHRRALWAQAMAALPAASRVAGDAALPETWEDLLRPARAALHAGPQRFGDLARLPDYVPRIGALNPAFQLLAQRGEAHPLLVGNDVASAQAFNRAVSAAALQGGEYGWLAAPAIGSGIAADALQMAAVDVLSTHPGVDATRFARETATRVAGRLVMPAGQTLAARVEAMWREDVPRWRQLGVVPA